MKSRNHTVLITVTIAAALVALSGCSAVSGGSASGTSTPTSTASSLRPVHTVTYVNPRPSYGPWNTVGTCFATQAKKYGWKVNQVGTSGTTVDNQAAVNLISESIASGTDGLAIVPLDPALFTPVIQSARSKGLYVVGVDSGDPTNGENTEVGTNGTQFGILMADGLGKVDPNAHVGFLSVSATTTLHVQIINGFMAEAKKKFPGMKFVSNSYDNGDATQDVDIFNNMITAHPDITAIATVNGSSVSAAVTAVQEAGKTGKIRVLAASAIADATPLLTAGTLYGAVDQGWCDMGTKAAVAIKDASEGKKIPAQIPTTSKFYTRENLPAN
jgi:ribose transport system substrate-binding protein